MLHYKVTLKYVHFGKKKNQQAKHKFCRVQNLSDITAALYSLEEFGTSAGNVSNTQ